MTQFGDGRKRSRVSRLLGHVLRFGMLPRRLQNNSCAAIQAAGPELLIDDVDPASVCGALL